MEAKSVRLSDEEVFRDWQRLHGYSPTPYDHHFIKIIGKMRQKEPRINCGTHLEDYMMICDDDDDMDSFYGKDYPW